MKYIFIIDKNSYTNIYVKNGIILFVTHFCNRYKWSFFKIYIFFKSFIFHQVKHSKRSGIHAVRLIYLNPLRCLGCSRVWQPIKQFLGDKASSSPTPICSLLVIVLIAKLCRSIEFDQQRSAILLELSTTSRLLIPLRGYSGNHFLGCNFPYVLSRFEYLGIHKFSRYALHVI